MRVSALSVLFLAACGTKEEDFATQFPSDFCAWVEECVSTSTSAVGADPLEATCEEALVLTVNAYSNDESCAYDAAQADACLEAIAVATCDDRDAIESACGVVYGGDVCNLTLADF
jgi:hypothetical protein